MIGYLEGTVKYSSAGKILLFANGIGFKVSVPQSLISAKGDKLKLFIHTHLRDDDLSLFGFATGEDLDLFETLIGVNGVGPKTALSIFSHSSATQIISAIATSNLAFFTAIPGIGKKTSQRVILDLKSKLSKGDVDMESLAGNSELTQTLLALGFQKSEISTIIGSIDSSESISAQVKSALKLLRKS